MSLIKHSACLNLGENTSSDVMIAKAENLAYVIFDENKIVVDYSENFMCLAGISDSLELIGLQPYQVFSELQLSRSDNSEIHENIPNLLVKLIDNDSAQRASFLATTKDGRRVQFSAWYDGAQTLLATIRDVSEYQRHRDLLEMAMEAANAGFWSMSFETGKFTYSNSVLKRLSETETQKIQDHGLWSIIHKADLPEITKAWQAIIAGTRPFDLTYRVVTQMDGTMWQRSTGRIERGSDGHLVGATAFVTDITRDVKKQKELLEAKEGSKAKSEFLARMSHEIRTPLNAIIGMSDSLKEEDLSDEVLGVIGDIEQAADGLHQLLSRTLDHTKLISEKMQVELHEEDIRKTIDSCYRLWRPQSSAKSVALNVLVGPEVSEPLLIDSFRIQQCLNNLLSNAVKFTEKGRIDLIVKFAVVKNRKSLVIAVKDTGIGMSEEESKSIFDPFSQADGTISRKYGGTGLGMSITKQLTELMGGHLKVKSESNVGTTFIMVLPILENEEHLKQILAQSSVQITPPPEKQIVENESTDSESRFLQEKEITDSPNEDNMLSSDKAVTEMPLTEKPFEGLSVLCVEDNPTNQKVVKRLIGKRVKALYFANNGRQALDVLSSMHVDVVLMDIHMPVMDGIEATLEIRSSEQPWASVIIIALTADPDYQQKRICKNIGMDDTIAKPVRRQDIFSAFDRTLGKINMDFAQPVTLSA